MGLKDDDNTKKFLEPSAGNGAFLANSPYKNCSFMAIEKDLTTYRILDLLYPQQTTICAELQAVDFTSRDKFDAVIGNPPYSADVKIRTEKDSKLNGFRLHDYFSLKSQKLLKEGGINAFVTSTSFLDNPDPEARIKISENSTFIAAVRLPEGIFKSSGTQVPTDIVFFQEGYYIFFTLIYRAHKNVVKARIYRYFNWVKNIFQFLRISAHFLHYNSQNSPALFIKYDYIML